MPAAPPTTYDELPYDDHVFAPTHPATLATVAALHGLDPPPVDRCRVLDLGCATGANLWPMALGFPQSEFVGVDLSPVQVARGREVVADLGLANVALHARNVLEPTEDLGTFDYVIAHGLYSWVPPAVQDRVLELIRRQLAPDGVAYVSYNVYPGWHLRGLARDLMAFHAAGVPGDTAARAAAARAFLDFFTDALPEADTPYANALRKDAERLRATPDSYIAHEFLEADNRPVLFHEFAAHAAAHGLQYLAEAAPQPFPGRLKPGVLEAVAAAAGDRIRLEQYLDFFRCRTFRRSLLCHAAANPRWDGAADRVPAMAVSSRVEPTAVPDPDPAGREEFVTPDGVRFATADPAVRAALWRLWDARPAAVPFPELLAAARGRGPDDGPAPRLADAVLQLYLGDIVELHRHPPRLAAAPGPRPCAGPLARLQAARGAARVFTLRHTEADPDPFARYLLPLLDGIRDRAGLVDVLAGRAAAGEFAVTDGDDTVTDPGRVREVLAAWVEEALDRLAKAALLTA